jgi:hypothetical protein
MNNHSSGNRSDAQSASRLIKNKGPMIKGALLFVTFLIVLVAMFSPIFRGENALKAADRLFNSIAKGSTHYIPGLLRKNDAYKGKEFTATLQFPNDGLARNASKILALSGAAVTDAGQTLTVKGDLGKVLSSALQDSDAMFANEETAIKEKYGLPGKEALFVWWSLLKETDKDLTREKRFKDAAFVSTVIKKGVEVGYNFFGIVPQTARSRAFRLSFSLLFYVIYTLWWGIAVLLIFEGIGLEMKAGAKKEV